MRTVRREPRSASDRRAIRGLLLLLGASVLGGEACQSQTPDGLGRPVMSSSPKGAVTFMSVVNASQALKPGEALVHHPVKSITSPAELTIWPASFFFTFKGSSGPTTCSGTLIGSRTLVTAAHCVPDSGKVMLVSKGAEFEVDCLRHDKFNRSELDSCWGAADCPATSDVALCRLSNAPFVTRLEAVETSQSAVAYGSRLLLSGFGCVDQKDESAAQPIHPSVLTVGWAAVRQPALPGNAYIQTVADLSLGGQPAQVGTGSELCKGDSGGGTYIAGMNPATWPKRKLAAINSAHLMGGSPSLLVSLASNSVQKFMRSWAQCGMAKCSNGNPSGHEPTDICGVYDVQGTPNPLCGKEH